jgi:branched-chain amino acid transport system ATP-binding protein
MSAMLLSVRDLAAGYGDEPITRHINLDVENGTITTIVGSNGAGKSTLLKAIYGLNRRFTGTIVFDGQNIETLAPVARFRLGLGFVPQGRCNFPLMSVRENLRLGGYSLSSVAREASIERVTQIFPILNQRMNVMAGNLSGGEQQLLENGDGADDLAQAAAT